MLLNAVASSIILADHDLLLPLASYCWSASTCFLAFFSLLYSLSWWSSLVSDLKVLNIIYRLSTPKLIHSTQTSYLNSRLTYLTVSQIILGAQQTPRLKQLLILRQPQICSSRSFPHLTWENSYPSGEHLSQNSKGCSQQLLLSNHTASLRANTGVVSSKQCRHPISCLYHHYHLFGLNVATIISHLNYDSLLTGLLYSIP